MSDAIDNTTMPGTFSEVKLPKRPLSSMPGRLYRRLLWTYRRWFCNRNYVFRHDGPFMPESRTDCKFLKCRTISELPESLRADIIADGGPSRIEEDKRELSDNATLWLAVVDGRVASAVFTRKGSAFRRWFVTLADSDVVVFRLRTHEDFRGRGLAPSLIRHCLHQEQSDGCRAFIDCRTYNSASIRCIEKVGFIRFATKKTIRREWALYE